MYPCSVESDLRRYEREQDRLAMNESRIDAMIEEMADDMLLEGGEFFPYQVSMLDEAISERSDNNRMEIIAKLLEKKEYEAAGCVLNALITDYCKDSAVRRVKREKFL